jgi:hypothetical protein
MGVIFCFINNAVLKKDFFDSLDLLKNLTPASPKERSHATVLIKSFLIFKDFQVPLRGI